MTKQADLLAYLFEGEPHALSSRLLQWMQASSRFTAFVEAYRDKIRKKIRVIREPESALDLGAELEVACGLLSDRRFELAYEPYASAGKRSPDFAVTYRANLIFNVEVARLRVEEREAGRSAQWDERILRILFYKMEQMQPGMGNLLVIHSPQALVQTIDLEGIMRGLKTRVETKDPAFYEISRYANPAAFYKNFLRLSGIFLWAADGKLWNNKQARPGVPEKVLRLLCSLPARLPPA